jgi:transcription elongation GreA/GreB family factor
MVKFYTTLGRFRLLEELDAATKEEGKARTVRRTYLLGAANKSKDDSAAESAPFDNALAMSVGRAQTLRDIFKDSREFRLAPEPTLTDDVRIGHYVTLKCDPLIISVEIGGFGESTSLQTPHVWSYNEAPGKLLMRKSVGDTIELSGKEYEIIQIELRSEYEERQKRQNAA